jgi:hypothetical protein
VAGKLSASDPGREQVVRMLREVVADEHVEQVRVPRRWASASATSCRSRVVGACSVARVRRSTSPARIAAATCRGVEVESAASARISAGASGWSPIRRRRRAVLASGTDAA